MGQTLGYASSQLASRAGEAEFIARLLLGVHGQPDIGFRNPFTPEIFAGSTDGFPRTQHPLSIQLDLAHASMSARLLGSQVEQDSSTNRSVVFQERTG